MSKLDDYKDLRKVFNYDKKRATRLAGAMTEANELKRRLEYLNKILADNIELKPYLWQTVDGKVIAHHDIEDDHLKNIIGYLAKTNQPVSDELRAEAESRDIDINAIISQTPRLPSVIDDDDDDWGDGTWWLGL